MYMSDDLISKSIIHSSLFSLSLSLYICIYIYTLYIILNMSTPYLKPIEVQQRTCKQGHNGDIVPNLPMRSMLVVPSGSGHTVMFNEYHT